MESAYNGVRVVEVFPDAPFEALDKQTLAQNASTLLELFSKASGQTEA